jgi:7,8-dihydropterin-6-yl-methyl-4-(beta-D-ribofuranosyl)aminobenzene 5'-phosphate synthase
MTTARITCLVDNAVRFGSRLWGEHGLAFLVETPAGRVLFDSGATGSVLLHNLEVLSIPLSSLTALVLSHGHYDHTGGLSALFPHLRPDVPLFAHSGLFAPRFSRIDGIPRFIGFALGEPELREHVTLYLSRQPQCPLPELWTTGEIAGRAERSGGSAWLVVPDGDGWRPDPYEDDLSLVLESAAGLVVICGCCHAGLLNTLAHVQASFPRPIVAILGGAHLVEAEPSYARHVAAVLDETYGAPQLYLNHCTGDIAYREMVSAFGERAQPCPAGTTLTFDLASSSVFRPSSSFQGK